MVTEQQIREFVSGLVTRFRPRKVILFGSRAYGKPRPHSDVDLCVILPFRGSSVRKSVEIRMALRPRFPLDLIVRTPRGVAQRLAMGDDFFDDILTHGRVLYETPGR